MLNNVLQLMKIYKGNSPLINSMVKADSADFRTIACYLTGTNDGNNGMDAVADKTLYCQLHRRKVFWTNYSTVRKVARIIDDYQIDIVVCQFRRAMGIGVAAALLSKRRPKVIGVMHGIVGGRVSFSRRFANFLIYRRLSRLVSVSIEGISDILKMNLWLSPDKVVAIQNGIICDPYLSPPNKSRVELFGETLANGFLFAMVGRLAPKKNHERVIRALAELKDNFPNTHLIIVGEGPERIRLENVIERLNVSDNVHFLGFRADIPDIVKNVDVFMLPSIHEGLPLALMEAMAAGRPVITSDVGGMKEVVNSEDVGLLVDPHSQVSIARAMHSLLSAESATREIFGRKARDRVLQQFTHERMANDYENLYREVLASNTENSAAAE